ncbi:hypothetical protein QYE76_066902 [Lolium multiflorum]|uniref:CCHC-type domain-containing protein n=1 Tax=Lolium multiflorum TaxID=4521 RepID=A0AAD8WCJ4_LOLMU|nr:hypothetical protein QYE76_066902 [Lolium multiflorum]
MTPAPSSRPAPFPTLSSKPVSNVSNTKKLEPAACGSGSSMSTTRNHDMACHTCGGKGHFKRDCPNRKVMIINDDDEYETGDDADPNAPEDDKYDSDGVDAYPSEARTIVVSQRALNVQPSASTHRCNLFQTKALVGPDKACKESHAGGLMGHFGREKTLLMLADHFYWPMMRRDVDRYKDKGSIARGGGEQLYMVLDMKTSHGRAREEREACAKEGEEEVQAGATLGDTGRHAGQPGATGSHAG